MLTPLAGAGGDRRLRKEFDPESGRFVGGHKLFPVHQEMLSQIALDFRSLPDVRTLSGRQIRYFYNSIRNGLVERAAHKKRVEQQLAQKAKR